MAELEFEIEEPDTGTEPEADALVRESFAAVDTAVLTRLVEHAFNRMRVSQSTYLSIAIVNEREMERIHLEWMDLPGPTDVMSFPMDELDPRHRHRTSYGDAGRYCALPTGGCTPRRRGWALNP